MSSSSSSQLAMDSSSARRQRAHLDERKRQRALYHLGDSSTNNYEEESESHHDPLHITAVGMNPLDPKALATSMSRKFFLTPPERLQVDQSVNLMDVETGQYESSTWQQVNKYSSELPSRGSNSSSGLFSGLMSSYTHTTTSSPQSSSQAKRDSMRSMQLHNFSEASKHAALTNQSESTLVRKERHTSFIEAFLDEFDEELGSVDETSRNSSKKKRRRRRKKKLAKQTTTTPLQFPKGYNPNLWEQRAVEAKSQPLLSNHVDSAVNTIAHGDKSSRRRGRRHSSRRRTRLRPGRIALLVGGIFVVLAMILLPLLLTGQILWHKWHPSSPPPPVPHIVERNHSYLDLGALPTSTQFLLQQEHTPQHRAVQWLQQDPQTSVVSHSNHSNNPMDQLAALQKFVLTTLYYSTDGPHWGAGSWMDVQRNECDWFGKDRPRYSVCNRYHQLHAVVLPHGGLKGRLPTEELTLLSNLKHLDLSNNSLTGIVPGVWFQGWRNLEVVHLENNMLTGQLPSELGLLTNSNGLRELHLDGNQFTGSIPTQVGGLMNHLSVLAVANNRLTGSIPVELAGRGDYRALQALRLNGNDLTGVIPSELGLLTQLTELQLHHNFDLTRRQDMPREICELPLLDRLTVDCEIVTCPAGCTCTCMEPPPPTELVSGSATVSVVKSSSKPEEKKPAETKPEASHHVTSSNTETKTHKAHPKITGKDRVKPATSNAATKSSSNAETKTMHTTHHITKTSFSTTKTAHSTHNAHPGIYRVKPETSSAPTKSFSNTETKTRNKHPKITPKVKPESSIAAIKTSSSNTETKTTKVHPKITRKANPETKITNDLAPSPSQGEMDLPEGELLHEEATILKRPNSTPQSKEELIGGSSIQHRPGGRFLRFNTDSL